MVINSKEKFSMWRQNLIRYRGVSIFVLVVMVAHFLWRLFIVTGIENREYVQNINNGRDIELFSEFKNKVWSAVGAGKIDREKTDGQYIALLNKDLTPTFIPLAEKTASLNLFLMQTLCGQPVFLMNDTRRKQAPECATVLTYDKEHTSAVNIVWGCTGVKQIYVFFLIMVFAKGLWRRKLVYFFIGVLVLLTFNVIRITSVLIMLKSYPDSFEFLHDGLFKYLFYGILFLLWMLWEDRYSIANKKCVA